MSRYLGKNLATLNEKITTEATRSSFTQNDFYSKYVKRENNSNYKYRCLDLSDRSLNNSPLARYHQVVISGDYWEPDKDQSTSKSGNSVKDALSELITNFNTNSNYYTTIAAQLPSEFSYNIGGNWSAPMKKISEMINQATWNQSSSLSSMLTMGQNSLVHNLTTMSVWESPKPLQISLTLQCVDDIQSGTNVNTLEAIDLLSRWALPYGVNKLGTYTGIPGPAVPGIKLKYLKRDASGKYNKETSDTGSMALKLQSSTQRTGRLSVVIGGMLFLDWCFLKDIKVSYPNTKAMYLHDYTTSTFSENDAGIRLLPIRTNITLTFETIQGLTQTNFRNMLALVEQKYNTNDLEIDLSGVQQFFTDASSGIVNAVKSWKDYSTEKLQNYVSPKPSTSLNLTDNTPAGFDLSNTTKGFSLTNTTLGNSVPKLAL